MTDSQIVYALKAGDHSGADGLLELYGQRLLRSAYLLCGNEADAQDLVQQTLLQAIRSIHGFGGVSTLYTWLHGILLNVTRHYHRRHQRVKFTCTFPTSRLLCPPDSAYLKFDADSSELMAAVQQLSHRHREVVVLRFFEGLKLEQIAEQMGLSTGTIKAHLHNALKRLRKLLPDSLNL